MPATAVHSQRVFGSAQGLAAKFALLSPVQASALIAAAAGSVLALDWLTPMGAAVWLAYVPLMALALRVRSPRAPWILAAVGTAGTVAGLFLSPAGIPPSIALLNRSLGVGLLWAAAALLSALRRRDAALAEQQRLARDHSDLLQGVLNNVSVGVALVSGADLRYRFVNRAYQALAPDRTMLTRTIHEVWPETQPTFAERCREVLAGGRPFVAVDEPYKLTRSGADEGGDSYFTWSIHRIVLPEVGAGLLLTVWETTERKRAEEALRESEERFRTLVTASSDVVYRMSADWTEMRYLEGKDFIPDQSEPSRAWITKYLHPDDQAHIVAAIDEAIRTKTIFALEHRVIRVDGTLGWTFSRAIPILDAGGEIVEWFGAASDVTERKRAEEALRESEERFRTLADNISQLAWMADGTGWIHWYNRRWYDYTGTTFDQMQGWGWQKVHHPDHLDRVVARWKEAHAGGEPWEDTFPLRGTDGQYRWFLSRALPIKNADGTVIRWFGTNTDITEIREAEAARRESAERLHFALESCGIGAWDIDLVDHTAFRSPQHDRIFGYPEPLPSWTLDDFLKHALPEYHCPVVKMVHDATAARTGWTYECRIRRADGAIRWIWFSGRITTGANGHDRVVGVVQDVTERKQVEQELRELTATLEQRVAQRTRDLEESNAALEAFGYSVSHDLRAPLRTMQGFAKALVEDYAAVLDDGGRDYAFRISRGAERMDLLIQDLLAYSRLSRAEITPQPVELSLVVQDAARLVESPLKDAGGKLTIQSGLPAVLGHRATLVQVFANLLSNGLKFVAPGTTPVLHIWAERREGLVRVWVEDNGIGIEPEHQERIFAVFERLHGTESYPGTGIGLAIVKKGVERLGGRVGVESWPERGSQFWVELPEAPLSAQGTHAA